jgi:type II secretory ATPase GspE/PulE/Tfp pilus assembly ATPase PilB-like protein
MMHEPITNRESNGSATDTSTPEVLERLIRQAEQAGTSDIHLPMRDQTAEILLPG